ncbi:hypothetical protein FH972_008477 [Carpinus fangiana]|uniref:Stearoyl-[acyl-carrier-protein] 9-desaturase n=1 Tax=Carpinus fangiana TaxID=176857 RepID=A0A5N6QYY1_9ROSI|nr:hypothetical protein FH972_008477 [Carpinus fangiana]
MKHGDEKLAQICGTIAADEKRHEIASTKIVGKLFELDPNETIIAFADMMRRKILMLAHLMDYGEILEHLVAKRNVEKLIGLFGEGREAHDYVCGLAQRLRRLEERALARAKKAPTVSFSWSLDR